MPDGNAVLPLGRLSALRQWAEKNVVVGDGPRAGQPYRIGGAPWGEVLDSMDDSTLEQVTIRGSVQSGKTAMLIVAGLGHMAAGRSVLIFEPDDRLKRVLAARIVAWGRLCADEAVREAYEPKRPPHGRSTAAGGRLEVVSAREGGAGLMRTAEIVIVDELRAFHRDMLGELVDRTASYGGSGRLITASSAGYEDECRTTVELDKSDARHWFMSCPSCGRENIAAWANVIYKNRRAPIYLTPCCGSELDSVGFRHAVAAGRWRATKDEAVPGTRGFHIDCFLSPFESLPTIVRQWRRADAHRKQTGSMADVIAFQCGRLCVPVQTRGRAGRHPRGAGDVVPGGIRPGPGAGRCRRADRRRRRAGQ